MRGKENLHLGLDRIQGSQYIDHILIEYMVNEMDTYTGMSRKEQKILTRQRILDSALIVFARDGILAATTASVAEEAGIAHGSLFAHFGSQGGLISSVIEEFGKSVALRIHEAVESGSGIRGVLEAHLSGIGRGERFYTRLVTEAPYLEEGLRNSVVLIQSSIAFHLSQAIASASEAGLIKELPFPLLFNTWIGLLHHYLANRELFAPGASVIERHGEKLVEFFLKLIAKEEGNEYDGVIQKGSPSCCGGL